MMGRGEGTSIATLLQDEIELFCQEINEHMCSKEAPLRASVL